MRGCDEPLRRCDRTFACARGHSYDVARRGYINLLQPQDRKSPTPGDSKEAVEARARLVAGGVGRSNLDALLAQATSLDLHRPVPVVVDLGCGGGDALGLLAGRRPICGIGIDLSTPAIELAARRFPALTWLVANVDRHVPVLDGCASLVLSVHARRQPAECARILEPHGWLLVSIPAADDLIELREAVRGEAVARDRVDALVAEHEAHFRMMRHTVLRERTRCDRAALLDLLRGTYRGERVSEAGRVQSLAQLDVTLASDVVLFARR